MVEIKFKMLSVEELGEWITTEVPLLEQDEINAVMTLAAFLKDFEHFLYENPAADALYDKWLETPSEMH